MYIYICAVYACIYLLYIKSNIRPGTKFDRIRCESLTRKMVVSPSGRNQLRLCTEAHAGENRLHGGAQMSAAWSWSLQGYKHTSMRKYKAARGWVLSVTSLHLLVVKRI